jgi:SAM-dependent methyltransferase
MRSPQFELHADIEERHWWFRGRRRIMRDLARRVLSTPTRASVVDVGCGTGGNIAALSGEFSCIGVDSSAEAIELARRRYPEVRFFCDPVAALGDGTLGQAGLFLVMDVLEHVPDDFRLFSEILSAARPGAHLLITVPADMGLWSGHDESFGHYRRYDPERLALVWEGLPATPLILSHFNARLYPVIRLTRMLTRLRGRPFGRAGTDFRIPARPINALLEELFAGEARALLHALDGKRPGGGYSRGASLIALLRREAGKVPLRDKPRGLPSDPHDPAGRHEH